MQAKSLYNPAGVDSLEETMIDGNPTGILNFNKSRYPWAVKQYKMMRSCFWIPETVDTTQEGKAYKALSVDDQKAYDRVISSLSFIDSAIADSIADNLNAYITNKVINACLIEQAAQEVLHSSSYAVMLADTVENSDRVFNLYKTDLKLAAKNTSISKLFSELRDAEVIMKESFSQLDAGEITMEECRAQIKAGEVTPEKIFYAMIANQLVEGIFFQTGFATMYYLGSTKKMLGSADMIKEIHKDELFHLTLFEKMIKEFIKENPHLVWFRIRARVNEMFAKAYQIESAWMHYILGHAFTKEVTDATVAYFIKARMQAIGMYDEHGDPYGHAERTPLVIALKQREMANETRTNFFEGTVANYTKQELNWDEYADDQGNQWAHKPQQSYDDAIKDAKEKKRD